VRLGGERLPGSSVHRYDQASPLKNEITPLPSYSIYSVCYVGRLRRWWSGDPASSGSTAANQRWAARARPRARPARRRLSHNRLYMVWCYYNVGGRQQSPRQAPLVRRQRRAPAVFSPSTVATPRITHGCASPLTPRFLGERRHHGRDPNADGTVCRLGHTSRFRLSAQPLGGGSADTLAWAPSTTASAIRLPAAVSHASGASPNNPVVHRRRRVTSRYRRSSKAGGSVQTAGTRPTGFATSVSCPRDGNCPHRPYCTSGAASFRHSGFQTAGRMLNALGISSVHDDRELQRSQTVRTPGRRRHDHRHGLFAGRSCGWCGSTHSRWTARRRDHRQWPICRRIKWRLPDLHEPGCAETEAMRQIPACDGNN